jgi:hypothetical protein
MWNGQDPNTDIDPRAGKRPNLAVVFPHARGWRFQLSQCRNVEPVNLLAAA